VKYAVIEKHQTSFAVRSMCLWLEVSHAGFYQWRQRQSAPNKYQELDQEINQIFFAHKQRYGSPRITRTLCEQSWCVNEKTVAKRMVALNLVARAAKKFKATTNSNHTLPVAENVLQQQFETDAPNRVWVTDITYIWTDEGWLYLAVVLDLYARMVVGWSVSERMTSNLVGDALRMAWWRRMCPSGVIVHSDRGSQYCSLAYQKLLKDFGLICSMSKKGDCYDNAAMESWNHSLKVEAVHGNRFTTRAQANQVIFEYIEIYYNRARMHSKLDYQTPVQFEANTAASDAPKSTPACQQVECHE
jgi:putative transposase